MAGQRSPGGAAWLPGASTGAGRRAPRRAPGRAVAAAVAVLLALAAGGARAGLFDDEEARKAILDLRARIQASDERASARAAELAAANAQLLEQVQQLRRSLLDLNGQLETLRSENARLRGGQEQLARDVSELQRGVKDVSKGIDDRLRAVEPQKVTLDGREFLVDPEEKRLHDQAMATLRSGDFDKAAGALAGFLQRYPASGYAESVRFWLGNAQYGQKNYKEAIASFRAVLAAAPAGPRAAESLLAVANCQIEMKDNRAARRTLDELLKAYPNSEAAAAARERLGTLKG